LGAPGRYLALVLAVLCAGAALVAWGPRLLGAAGGPEAELVTLLKRTEREGLTLEVPGSAEPLISATHRFDRLAVSYDPASEEAFVAATLDFDGHLGQVKVSSLGVEKIAFRRRGGDWVPEHGLAPNLVAVVRALVARQRALEELGRPSTPDSPPASPTLRALLPLLLKRDAEAVARLGSDGELRALAHLTGREYRPKAWFIRVDWDRAEVSEDYRLMGALPDRPVDLEGTRRLSLSRSGAEFLFWPGLM